VKGKFNLRSLIGNMRQLMPDNKANNRARLLEKQERRRRMYNLLNKTKFTGERLDGFFHSLDAQDGKQALQMGTKDGGDGSASRKAAIDAVEYLQKTGMGREVIERFHYIEAAEQAAQELIGTHKDKRSKVTRSLQVYVETHIEHCASINMEVAHHQAMLIVVLNKMYEKILAKRVAGEGYDGDEALDHSAIDLGMNGTADDGMYNLPTLESFPQDTISASSRSSNGSRSSFKRSEFTPSEYTQGTSASKASRAL